MNLEATPVQSAHECQLAQAYGDEGWWSWDVTHSPDTLPDMSPPLREATYPAACQELRRLLKRIGWNLRPLARRMGVSHRQLDRLAHDPILMGWLRSLAQLHHVYPHPLAASLTLGNSPLLCPYGVMRGMIDIGWSERMLAERALEHRTILRRMLSGEARIPLRFSRWVELLAQGHRDRPMPDLRHLTQER